ncbi:hypothetical protein FHU36_007259 [Nonomuraea muscovyensis]|uniref:Uncharacterized protein n=1 Tax=Nonomuraea muscovyensis TaxID=1124761 RepID=A0A7X0EZX5_9ACTN|nr:hypothetical protein [Nonomuraea muscovyensis]
MKARAVKGGVPGLFVALRESSRESGARPVEVLA